MRPAVPALPSPPPGATPMVNAAPPAAWSADKGGALLRVEIAEPAPLGAKRGWRPAMPMARWRAPRRGMPP